MINRISLFVLIPSILFAGGEVPPQLDPYNPTYEPGVVLVKLNDNVQVHRDQLARSVNPSFGISTLDLLNLEFELSSAKKVFTQSEQRSVAKMVQMPQGYIEAPNLHNIYRLSFDENISVEMMVQAYSEDPNVEYAEPDYLMRMMETTPDDPMYSQQWHHAAVNAPALWDSTTGDTSQVIGIIDTGVDWDHPDLAENIWINWVEYHGAQGVDDDGNGFVDDIRGWDWISNDNDPNDDNSHGTHVAGIAGAVGNNGVGVTGVSWNSKIMCLKVLQSTGYGNSSDVAASVEYAGNNGATVMNLSLGSYGHSQVLENALAVAYNTTIEVAAAGNDARCIGPGRCPNFVLGFPLFPGAFSWVLGVQAGDAMGPMGFSNYDQDGPQSSKYIQGYNYEIKAPGSGINSIFPNGGYHSLSGTSMASPVVAGGIANILSYDDPVSTELFRAKLINSTGAHVDLFETLIAPDPDPVLSYVTHTLIDTCNVCDNDGRADAGETIELWFTVKNYGGYADSVTLSIDFAEFEDTTTAMIIDSSGYIGDISAYAELSLNSPIKIQISSDIENNRDIKFDAFFLSRNTVFGEKSIGVTAQRGVEYEGVLGEDTIWDGSQLIIVTNNILIESNITLLILPGTEIRIDPGKYIRVDGTLILDGSQDNPITVSVNSSSEDYWKGLFFTDEAKDAIVDSAGNYVSGSLLRYGDFSFFNTIDINGSSPLVENNRFHNAHPSGGGGDQYQAMSVSGNALIRNNNFFYIEENWIGYTGMIKLSECTFIGNFIHECVLNNPNNLNYHNPIISLENNVIFKHNSIGKNVANVGPIPCCRPTIIEAKNGNTITNNTIVNSYSNRNDQGMDDISDNNYVITFSGDGNLFHDNNLDNIHMEYEIGLVASGNLNATNNYWTKTDSSSISNRIFDAHNDFDFNGFGEVLFDPYVTSPITFAPAFIYKMQINSSLMGETILGSGTYQFDAYFNRAMDIEHTPFLTFGVDQPYTQHIVSDSSSWSADSTVWTAYYAMGIETGDGINRVRVSGARDDKHFEIPTEDQRFEFVLQAAGAASVQFIATPGIGKVDLEWPPASTDDALGYNMYRGLRLNDSTWASYEMINDILVTDSTYIDFVVIPDSTYRYKYTVLGTDFTESDPSKVISSTPFSAANGDANGDLSVNVLDIISMVSYVLEGDPQPFLFDAADLNGDDQVNVLDIIGVINVILGGTPKTSQASLAEAGVSLDEGELWVSSQAPIAGMQFTFTGASDDVRLSSSYPVEIGTKMDDKNNLTVILYSLKGEVVPSGAHEVLTISNGEDLQFESMLLSNRQGREIPSRQGSPEEVILPEEYVLKQNYPNPFNASTTIDYAVPKTTDIKMTIYNIRGQEMFSRTQSSVAPGWYTFTWNGSDLTGKTMASGLYLYRFEAQGFAETQKMLLLK